MPIAEEQRVIRQIVAMRAKGTLLKDVVERLNKSGAPTRNGSPWQFATVAAIANRAQTPSAA